MFFTTLIKRLRGGAIYALLVIALLAQSGVVSALGTVLEPTSQLAGVSIVFVSRRIPPTGSVYMTSTGSQPGVGPYSRFQVAAPGKLIVREASGALRVLVDGSSPTAASLNLIDVNAPDVSYDGTQIVFAGLVAGSYETAPVKNPGAWRIYVINVDGTGLRQVTFSDRDTLDLSQFREIAFSLKKYDDTDPVWLPDGRIVFSSTRWPSFSQYSGVRTSNLYVVNADGTLLHRITSERNGADRPLIDPVTGKIVYSRWWRNFRFAIDSMETALIDPANPSEGYKLHNGLSSNRNIQLVRPDYLWRNSWAPTSINPDGTGLALWAGGSFHTEMDNNVYGGAFTPSGDLIANFFPMTNMAEAAGFGGLRYYTRGPNGYRGILGVTSRNDNLYRLVRTSPPSFGIYQSNYATEPAVLPDGRLVISLATSVAQDYGLYTVNMDGSNLVPLYNNPGTTELRARVIQPRPLPPIIPDESTQVASLLPPLDTGPYDRDGTFSFQALNVYFNAPVDTKILSAMPVGSAATIRFFIDHQRWQQGGSHPGVDWPILLREVPVNPDGSVTVTSPANVPLFEQIRTTRPTYMVPLTGMNAIPVDEGGAGHVAGMNFGRPGEVQRCVGCHAGHTMIPVPENPENAQWTNLAPGAIVRVSSLDTSLPNSNGLIDRRVKMQIPGNKNNKYWISRAGQTPTRQWVQLIFPVPVTVRIVRPYNIPAVDSSIRVLDTTVRLYSDRSATQQVASASSGALSENGTDIIFNDVRARVVRIEITSVSGTAAALGEVEVIARGEAHTIFPVSSFADVPYTHPAWQYIETLYKNNLTAGCSTNPPKFCPDTIMDRAQSAVFMLRGSFGSSYIPAQPTHIFNEDWSRGTWAEPWAEAMYKSNLSAGCGTPTVPKFCPWDQLPRSQIAVFGLRLKYGNAYQPPNATGAVFADVTDPTIWYAKWVEQAYADELIPDCGEQGGKPLFCPNDLADRSLGAYVVVEAKGLELVPIP